MPREMKESGSETIGIIPRNWEIKKLKHVVKLFTGNSIKDEDKDKYTNPDNAVPYIATKDIDANYNTIDYNNDMYIQKSDSAFKKAPAFSTLLCVEGGSAGKKKALCDREVCFVNKLCCLTPVKVDSKFLFYYLNSLSFEEDFKSYMLGMIGGVSVSALGSTRIVIPTKEEQKRIVFFLDKKCNKINKVIQNTERSIEEYKKLKQSIITEAVTKGVRGHNREMKDSGIEWIGQIPKEWTIAPVKKFFRIENGSDPTTEVGDTPVYGSGSRTFRTCVEFKNGPTVLLGRKGTVNIPQYVIGHYWNVDTAFNTVQRGGYDLKLFYYMAFCFDYKKYSTHMMIVKDK